MRKHRRGFKVVCSSCALALLLGGVTIGCNRGEETGTGEPATTERTPRVREKTTAVTTATETTKIVAPVTTPAVLIKTIETTTATKTTTETK
jgi:hypothetical protein